MQKELSTTLESSKGNLSNVRFSSDQLEQAAKFLMEEVQEGENLQNASHLNPMNGSQNSEQSSFL